MKLKISLDYEKIYHAIFNPHQYLNIDNIDIANYIFIIATKWNRLYESKKGNLGFDKWFAKVYKQMKFYNDFNIGYFYLIEGSGQINEGWNKKHYAIKLKK